MKKIGMIVAVEMDAVLQLYGAPKGKEKRGGFTVYTYENTDYVLYVLNSGAGELGAAAATQLLISVYEAELIVNFGVVGGLTEAMTLARTVAIFR